MENLSKKRISAVLAVLLLCAALMAPAAPASAASKTAEAPGVACKDGRYIYYAFEMSGVRMGIMRYDTKTKKKKQITGYKLKGKSTNGFYDLSVKGKYIYAVWDQFYGSGSDNSYIYRINKKTGKKKKLAQGTNPVVVGKYIYYEKVKNAPYEGTIGTGTICRMTLTGKKKKTVKTGITRTSETNIWSDLAGLYAYGNTVLYARSSNSNSLYTLKGKEIKRSSLKTNEDASYYANEPGTIVSGGYKYYMVQSGSYPNMVTALYRRKISSGKTSKIASYSSISMFRKCGNYLLIKATTGSYTNNSARLNVICMKLNGKAKKKLASWIPGE